MFTQEQQKMIYGFDSQILWIEPYGENSLRFRATMKPEMPLKQWALLEAGGTAEIQITEEVASIKNGKIRAEVHSDGRLSVYNDKGERILDEYLRNYNGKGEPYLSPLVINAREFKPRIGGDYELTVRFESQSRTEKIYGMGHYQQENLELKGSEIELSHRNSQSSVPFHISSLGYGFLWNNPSIGRATFGTNITTWYAASTDIMDYWVTVGDTPQEIHESYMKVTGTPPMMPEWASGLWQSKLRYRTQEELLEVAREHKRRGVPISVIVIDYFHWKKEGEWSFDERYWPDPKAMVEELEEMGIKLMVSVWPTVQNDSENYQEMLEKGYLMRVERGIRYTMVFRNNTIHYDPTKAAARDYVWNKVKKNYYDSGIKIFWLDEAEPELTVFDYDNYRYSEGTALQIGNIFPAMYAKTFYDGMTAEGQEKVINLIRTAWAGSQRYGALLWSGDIDTTFESMRRQLAGGLNSGMAGIPWWTSDIGGFRHGGNDDPKFRELLTRWFQWGAFCPVMRMHGVRFPTVKPSFDEEGIMIEGSGAPNEIWSYGEEVYEICKKFVAIRERLRSYIMKHMENAHVYGTPIMRPIMFDFPQDDKCWAMENETEFMFGDELLVAPILYEGDRSRKVYLPKGKKWVNIWTKEVFEGGQEIEVDAPIEIMPVFAVEGSGFEDLGK